MSADVKVFLVTGDFRVAEKVYEDGSVNCPWCFAAIRAHELPHCPNPACFAAKHHTPERLGVIMAEVARREDERARETRQRLELNAWRETYERERATAERARVDAVVAAGYCERCFRKSGGRKTIRHRLACKA